MTPFIVHSLDDLYRLQAMHAAGAVPNVRYDGIRYHQRVPGGIDPSKRWRGAHAMTLFVQRLYAQMLYGKSNASYLTEADKQKVKLDFVEHDSSHFGFDATRALNALQVAAERLEEGKLPDLIDLLSIGKKGDGEKNELLSALSDTVVSCFKAVPDAAKSKTFTAAILGSAVVASLALVMISALPYLFAVDAHQAQMKPAGQTEFAEAAPHIEIRRIDYEKAPVSETVQKRVAMAAEQNVFRARKLIVSNGPGGVAMRFVHDEFMSVMPAMLDMAVDTVEINGAFFSAKAVKRLKANSQRVIGKWSTTTVRA